MAIDYTHPMNVCRASAGTGKTFTLAAYYVGLLLKGESYRNILAVTFTNKATAEMKERILGYLYAIANGEADEAFLAKCKDLADIQDSEEKIRNRAAYCFREMLLDYDNVQVSTIDSFLQSLLSGMAQLLGKATGFKVELNLGRLITQAVDLMLTSYMTPEISKIVGKYMVGRLENEEKWDLRKSLIDIANEIFREDVQMLLSDGKVELDEAKIEYFKKKLHKWQEHEEMFKLSSLLLEAEKFARTLSAKKEINAYENAIIRLRRSLAGDETLKSDDRFRGMTVNQLRDYGGPLANAMEEQARICKQIYWEYTLTAECLNDMTLLRSLKEVIDRLLQENNRMLLANTADTLRNALKEGDADFILEKAGIRYKHIMIDEFQDTSTLQWQVFKPLIADVLAGEGHTLLIVGDIKQSIYRWRNGDWHIMANLGTEKDDLKAYYNPGFLPLVRNFRSMKNVVGFNLETMRQIANLYNDDQEWGQKVVGLYDEGYAGEETLGEFYNKKNDKGYVQVRAFLQGKTKIDPAGDLRKKAMVDREILEQMFDTIRELLDQGEAAENMMILVRKNVEAMKVVKYFEQLPWRDEVRLVSSDSFKLSSSQSVQVIVNALQVAEELYTRELSIQKPTIALRYLQMALSEINEEEWAEKLQALAATNKMPLYEQIQAIIRLLLSNEEGKCRYEDVAYIGTLLDKVLNFVGTDGSDRALFLQYWHDGMNKEAIATADSNAIRIMTVHSSKGLESKTLFIPFCDWKLVDTDKHPKLWVKPARSTRINKTGSMYAPVKFKSQMLDTDYEKAYRREEMAQRVDNLNLLYVALTRAANNLFVYTRYDFTKKDGDEFKYETVGDFLVQRCDLYDDLCEQRAWYTGEGECYVEYTEGEEPYIQARKKKTEGGVFSFQGAEQIETKIESHTEPIHFRQSQESLLYGHYGAEKAEEIIAHINIGTICHDILSQMVGREEQENVVEKFVRRGIIASENEKEEVEKLINAAWKNEKMCAWFDGSWELLREQAIVIDGKEKRPDRVMIKEGKAIVVDYKFGSENSKYKAQVREYMDALKELGYKEVEGYLWYARKNEMQVVE